MKLKADNNGFTLIELIVVIVIGSIFATMMYQYVYTSSVRSFSPVSSLDNSLKLYEIVENITSDYLANHTSDLTGLQTGIGKPEDSDQDNDYGVYRVIDNHFIKFVDNSEQTALIDDSEYGKLLKVTIKYISSGETLTILYNKK
ncbi:type II secretion system protein [Desulfobacula toluolica]|uniref:Uncharacterized protein containing N-terminal methylation motif n=1 Tax=Desulfobacula toluolica (strain DSM 7467 / Tol2) TaxID=651182 RepID=K0NGD2_DESTT|nr:prepilin-type N-terminal cleavage/methylation domain-containing protein [Desulfobacula toluolica]CCK78878.1 uncharacterized protein containing N-terminal methylation motif [Desulfobacula toluolica Tol2]